MLLEALIAQICVDLSGPEKEACHNALKAASVQTEIAQNVETIERSATRRLEATAVEYIDRDVLGAVGATYKVFKDKSISYPVVKNEGLTPSVVPTIGINGGSVNLGWRF